MTKLTRREFEELAARMLRRQGFELEVTPRAADVGVDLIATDRKLDRRWAVQLKYQAGRKLAASATLEAAWNLRAAREFVNASEALLIVDSPATPFAHEMAAKAGVSLVDGDALWRYAENTQGEPPQTGSRESYESRDDAEGASRPQEPITAEETRDQELRNKLAAITCGWDQWRDYEDLGIEILNHLFRPPLGVPRIQTISDDGLDRRDAVYKIGYGSELWNAVKSECRTRFLVAEFKNGCAEPGQRDVESLEQYLWGEGLRSFGILCSRKRPSESALVARRRAWTKSRVLIIFVDDGDFVEMLAFKGAKDDPTIVLDKKIDDFFSSVSA